MHGPRSHQGPAPAIWLIAGTGEGPPLARALLAAGWRVRVSLVSAAAARAYAPHPRLQLAIGELAGAEEVAAVIAAARRRGAPFRWVLDASHPFAELVSAHLQAGCRSSGQPLLRLSRVEPGAATGQAVLRLPQLAALEAAALAGPRLLLAIGARRLAAAVALTPGALHHARVLPRPAALQQALAAGLPPQRLAVLQPGLALGDGRFSIERALCRQWRIEVVLCRASGGLTEALWRRVAADLQLQLLLLERPAEPPGSEALPLESLLARVGRPGDGGSMEGPCDPSADA